MYNHVLSVVHNRLVQRPTGWTKPPKRTPLAVAHEQTELGNLLLAVAYTSAQIHLHNRITLTEALAVLQLGHFDLATCHRASSENPNSAR